MDKPKVLIIIPNLGKGGAQRVFHQQFAYLSTVADVIGCVFNWDGAFESDKNSNIISLNVPGGSSFISKIYCFWKRCVVLKQTKRKHGIQISISHLEGADYVNILSNVGDRSICWIHGTKKFDDNIEGLIGWLRHNVLIPFLYRKSELVTVSEGIRNELIKEYKIKKDRVRYIPNGFDVEAIQNKARESIDQQILSLGIQGPIKTLACHCRLVRQKNLKAMLDIYSRVKQWEKVRLIILGDGELRDELFEHSEKLGLRTFSFWKQHHVSGNYDVYFLGHFDNPYPIVSKSNLYMMTSSWEGFPLALCEAMACGVPVISTDCFTGPREVIAPATEKNQPVDEPLIAEHGVLMPLAHSENEIQLWSREVKNILQDELTSKRLAVAGPQRVRDFDLRKIQQQWLELINE